MLRHVAAMNQPESTVEELKSIFVISPIGKKNDDGVDFTDLFLEQIVKPAAKEAGGFKTPVRADEVKAPGSITAKIVVDIVNADVCVADLTQRNPNVMYEVAIAHAAGKPVILMQQEETPPPFDFTGERAIHYSLRVDEANKARDDLVDYLRNAHHDELDPKLASTMHPVRVIFRDLKSRAEAKPSELVVIDRLDALDADVTTLTAGVRDLVLSTREALEGTRAVPGKSLTQAMLVDQLELFGTALTKGEATVGWHRRLRRELDGVKGEVDRETGSVIEALEVALEAYAGRNTDDPEATASYRRAAVEAVDMVLGRLVRTAR